MPTARMISQSVFALRRVASLARDRINPVSGRLVSIVVPAHNEAKRIDRCLSSVRRQTYRDFECVVVDDASTDGTAERVSAMAAADSRFRLVAHLANRGLSAARNTGLASSQGELVTFLDGDDYLYQGSLADRVRRLGDGGDPTVAGAYCGILSVPDGGMVRERFAAILLRGPTHPVTFLTREGESPFPVHAPMVRRDVLDEVGGFREDMLDGCEDWDLWQRLLRAGYRFLATGTVGAAYRMRPGSMRINKSARHSMVAAGLIRRAYADHEANDGGAPVAFPQGLGAYLMHRAEARRLIRGATLSLLAGDHPGADVCLQAMAGIPAVIFTLEIDLKAEIAASVRLFLAGRSRDRTRFPVSRDDIAARIRAATRAS